MQKTPVTCGFASSADGPLSARRDAASALTERPGVVLGMDDPPLLYENGYRTRGWAALHVGAVALAVEARGTNGAAAVPSPLYSRTNVLPHALEPRLRGGRAPLAMDWLTPQLATLVVAAVALAVGCLTVGQKWRSDRREAWWKRAEWAIDKSLSDEPEQRDIGNRTMGILANERGVGEADLRVLQVALLRSYVDFR